MYHRVTVETCCHCWNPYPGVISSKGPGIMEELTARKHFFKQKCPHLTDTD